MRASKWFCFGTVAVLALSVTVLGGPRAAAGARDKASLDRAPTPADAVSFMREHQVKPTLQIEALGDMPGSIPVIRNDGSPLRGTTAAGEAQAYVFKNDYWSGYGVFLNYTTTTGAYFPGTMMADEMILGNGFVPGGTITGYGLAVFRSSADPTNNNTLATYTVELWDGDPFGAIDTTGFSGAAIAGTTCVFSEVPGPGYFFLECTFPAPVVVPNDRVWMVLTGADTCRTGWIISFRTPEVGAIYMGTADIWEMQEDYYGQFDGAGVCCDPDDANVPPCAIATNPCAGDTNPASPRGFCTDGDAESAGLYYFGGPCDGNPATDSCASFYNWAFTESDTFLGVMPIASSDPAAIIDGYGITLDDCTDTNITFEIKIKGWDPNLDGTPKLKTWEADLDSSGYYFSGDGYLTPTMLACADSAACVAAWGGACSLFGNACTSDAGCNTMLGEVCGGPACDYPTGVGGYCTPGYQMSGRTDGLLLKELPAVDLSSIDFRFGSTLSPSGTPKTDGGILYYGGTLKLTTSSYPVAGDAYVLLFAKSFMKDGSNNPIPLVGLQPATVTCPVGQCCDLSVQPFVCMADGVSEEQCAELGGVWTVGKTCADDCGCLEDFQCDDGDGCTIDTCVDSVCLNTPVSVPGGSCCDSATGNIAAYDDGNECTDDFCSEGGTSGVPAHSNVADGTACEEPWTQCWKQECMSGACEAPVDINTISCTTDADCYTGPNPSAYCDLATNMCVCISCFSDLPCYICEGTNGADVDNPGCDPDVPDDCGFDVDCIVNTWACTADLVFKFNDAVCYDVGQKVFMEVWFENSLKVINGAQFTVTYDPTCLDYNSIQPAAPYSQIYKAVNEAAGTITYAVGAMPPAVGTADTGKLATISFTKLVDCETCAVDFAGENPVNTYLTDDEGQVVCALPHASDDVMPDDNVVIDVPDDVVTNVDCDMVTAEAFWDAPTAVSDCYGPIVPVCAGTYPDDTAVPAAVVMGGGEFPIGVSNFCCNATDACGVYVEECWTVTVNEQTTLDVVVQLSPVINADDLARCIDFELYANCVEDPFTFSTVLPFGGMWDHVGHYTAPLKIPAAGQWFCITARDQLHTLRSTAYLECVDGVYYAVFKGDPFFGGNWLIGGNLDGYKKDNPNASHNVIDILDFGQFVAHYLESMDPNTDCETMYENGHADINGDGIVNSLDFAFIQMNFLASSKDACCPGSVSGNWTARTEVSVRELRQMGLGDLSVADLNQDGLVNVDDMSAFMAGQIPTSKVPARGLHSR